MNSCVQFTPTHPALVEAMLDLAELRPGDVLMDLGSGDGRIVIAAAKRGVRAIGIECRADLVGLSTEHIQQDSLSHLAEIREGDLFKADLREATVITMFLDREPHKQLLRKLSNLKPGVRIISNTFHLWEHDAEREVATGEYFTTARLWRRP